MAQNYFGFPVNDDLQTRMSSVIQKIQNSELKRPYALELFQVINDLSEAGLNYFFIDSLKKAGIGKIKMIAVENSLNMCKKAIMTVGKGIIKAMSDDQLHTIANFMEESLVESQQVANIN